MKKALIIAITTLSITTVFAQPKNKPESLKTLDKLTLVNEKTVNTPKLDFSPTFYEDGIVFLSSTPENDKSAKVKDSKISEQTFTIKIGRRGPEGVLNTPEVYAKELTSRFHEGPLSFDETVQNVFFSRNDSEADELIQTKCQVSGERCARQQIYTSQRQGDTWSAPKKISINNPEYAFQHPSLSIDGKKLYFSSNMPGGQGGYDIWVTNKIGEDWGEPINLGPKINTAGREAFPFIHTDGTLIYASDGLGGAGALDVFYALAEKNKSFTAPVNIGLPINSDGDDFGLILDLERKNGYFTSNREGGYGSDDIYSFTSEEPIINPKEKKKAVICVLDKADNSPIEAAEIKYSNVGQYEMMELSVDADGNVAPLAGKEGQASINILQIVAEKKDNILMTDATCKTLFEVPDGDYLVNVKKDGYAPKQIIIKTKADKDLYTVYLEKTNGKLVNSVLRNDRGLPIPNAMVTITDPETGETQTVTTDAQGRYAYVGKPNKKYTMTANKPNHDPITTTFTMPNEVPSEFNTDVRMKEVVSPLSKGRILELTNVYYNFNDASLRPDAVRDLEALVMVMNAYPEVEIELGSHTDSRGSFAYNEDLSQRRAESVVRYLTEHGVSKRRLIAKGYGENQHRNNCADGVECTEEEHQRNRRTEVRITKGASNAEIVVVDKEPEYTDPMPGRRVGGPAVADGANNNTEDNDNSITLDASDPNGSFWVVAGSFANQTNAVEQQNRFLNRGFGDTTVEFSEEVQKHRVVITKQSSMEAAERMAHLLRKKGISELFVVQR
jgi:outer membrane protein OmpA-like peptidoglycan-associated protein